MLPAVERVPALENVGIRKLMNGPESFTPDGNFILGETPEVKNYFVGAGFNAFGIAAAEVPESFGRVDFGRRTPMDLWVVDIRRFSNLHKTKTGFATELWNFTANITPLVGRTKNTKAVALF